MKKNANMKMLKKSGGEFEKSCRAKQRKED